MLWRDLQLYNSRTIQFHGNFVSEWRECNTAGRTAVSRHRCALGAAPGLGMVSLVQASARNGEYNFRFGDTLF
jgi:hypothetical protein